MITRRLLASWLIGICAITVLGGNAMGESIALYGTGLNSTGTALLGQFFTDPNYSVSSSPYGYFVPKAASTHSAWLAGPTATSQWINSTGDAYTRLFPGDYTYVTSFYVPNVDLSLVVIEGLWASDNSSTIYLNGTSVKTHPGIPGNSDRAFEHMESFSLTGNAALNLGGTNTLTFVVNNAMGATSQLNPLGSNPTGLHVQITKATVVPTPSALAGLAGMGLLVGLVGVYRRRKPR